MGSASIVVILILTFNFCLKNLSVDIISRMVKVYYTYAFSHPVAQFASGNSNIQILSPNFEGASKPKFVVSGTNQYICLISPKTGEVLKYLINPARNAQMVRFVEIEKNRIYAGYDDGMVVCYNILDILLNYDCLLYTSPSPRDKRQSRMPSSA